MLEIIWEIIEAVAYDYLPIRFRQIMLDGDPLAVYRNDDPCERVVADVTVRHLVPDEEHQVTTFR